MDGLRNRVEHWETYPIPVECLSCWRTEYTPLVMTPHYWQLFASQPTDLLLLPPVTRTWLRFMSGAITGARYRILTKLRLWWLEDLGL